MWSDLIRALALVCVLEGLMPFLVPEQWRETMQRLAQVPSGQLRVFGGVMIVAGAVVLHFVHQV